MDKIAIDFPEKELFIRLFGKEIYAVGGCVRDKIMNRITSEFDLLITHNTAQEIINKLKPYGRVDLVGKSFGVIKFTKADHTYDIALPRQDKPKKEKPKAHKDFIIEADPDMPVEADLKRRDFRCNSMAVHLEDGTVLDPFNGKEDINLKKIRLTNPKSFPDDPLRIIRAARFASVLGFSLEQKIYSSAKKVDLTGLSMERVNEELFKILLDSSQPSCGLEELFTLDALRQLFPELYALTLSIQDSKFHPEKDKYGHNSVWQHTKITVDQAKRLTNKSDLSRQEKLVLLLAALFHDIGKPATANWEFKKGRMVITNNRHDITGEKITKKVFDRLKIFSWEGYDIRKTVLSLIQCHHRASELWQNRKIVTKKAFNRLAVDVSGEITLLVYLDAADRAGRNETPVYDLDKMSQWIINKFKSLNVSKKTITPIIMGRDLMKLGIQPGPEMGKLLKQLYQLQLDTDFVTKKDGLIIAKKLITKEKE